MKEFINQIVKETHEKNLEAGWWHDSKTGEPLLDQWYTPYVMATKMLLTVSEVCEALEGYRKDLMDDKIPTRTALETELADVQIRLWDLCGALKIDLGGAIEEKAAFNSTRQDHKMENRKKHGGKKF
jgi:NTP pyrophosphatase (non-canonical NTP hydrolase)